MYSIEFRQFSTNIKIKIIKLKPSFVSPGLRPLAADKTGFDLKIFHFDIRGKLSIIRCDKYILLLVASLLYRRIFMTSHMPLSSGPVTNSGRSIIIINIKKHHKNSLLRSIIFIISIFLTQREILGKLFFLCKYLEIKKNFKNYFFDHG